MCSRAIRGNIKLTHPADFQEAERRLKGDTMTYITRLGTGFDVHAFGEGDHVWLGGIKVPTIAASSPIRTGT